MSNSTSIGKNCATKSFKRNKSSSKKNPQGKCNQTPSEQSRTRGKLIETDGSGGLEHYDIQQKTNQWVSRESLRCLSMADINFSCSLKRKWTQYRKLRRCKAPWQTLDCIRSDGKDRLRRIISYSCRIDNDIRMNMDEESKTGREKASEAISLTVSRSLKTRLRDKVSYCCPQRRNPKIIKQDERKSRPTNNEMLRLPSFSLKFCIILILFCYFMNEFSSSGINHLHYRAQTSGSKSMIFSPFIATAEASLIIGDSAIEIQEVSDGSPMNGGNTLPSHNQQQQTHSIAPQQEAQLQERPSQYQEPPSLILGSTNNNNQMINVEQQLSSPSRAEPAMEMKEVARQQEEQIQKQQPQPQQSQLQQNRPNSNPAGPLPPIAGGDSSRRLQVDDVTDGDRRSRDNHDYHLDELNSNDKPDRDPLGRGLDEGKSIAGKVVDFELQPAGGHNKAKIKKKKKKKSKKEESKFKKWAKKKKSEKKAMDEKSKKSMKKKKEEGKKKKKKWGNEEHGQKKKGKFKKKKWGKKVKKGKGVKKGKKGKKFLKDKGHKNTGFKKVYHKEEWGSHRKWHDIKREKKWDEKSKKWKKKWKKEKGKKYKGDHMKKFEKKKKSGKKYKKENAEKFKKEKKEKFEKGMKKKMEEAGKKKEGGAKKEMKKEEKKKKKKKKKKGFR